MRLDIRVLDCRKRKKQHRTRFVPSHTAVLRPNIYILCLPLVTLGTTDLAWLGPFSVRAWRRPNILRSAITSLFIVNGPNRRSFSRLASLTAYCSGALMTATANAYIANGLRGTIYHLLLPTPSPALAAQPLELFTISTSTVQ